MRRDRADVTRRGPLQEVPAARRETDVKGASVRRAGFSLNQTVALEAIDRARHTALRQERPRRQIGRTDASLGTSGDLHKEEVLTEREASSAVCQALKRVGGSRVGAQERLPAGLLGLAETPLALRRNRLRGQRVDCIIN